MRKLLKWTLLGLWLGAGVLGCAEEFSEGDKPQVQIIVNQQLGQTEVALAEVGQTQVQPKQYSVQLKNIGSADAQITSIKLLDVNPNDNTTGNPYLSINWPGAFTPAVGFPFNLKKETGEFVLTVSYNPQCGAGVCDFGGYGTLEILTDDPEAARTLISFTPPDCVQLPVLQPANVTFFNAKPSGGISAEGWCLNGVIVNIANQGTCNDNVQDVTLTPATGPFTLTRENSWPNNELLRPEEPLRFCINYNPTEQGASDTAQVQVSVSSRQGAPLLLSIKAEWESGAYQLSYDGQEKGFLDFTDVEAGCGTKKVNIFNEGPAVLKLKGLSFPEDNSGTPHYSVNCEFPPTSEGGNPTPIASFPAAVAANRTVECTVEYCAETLAGQNASLRISYDNPDPGVVDIPAFGGTPKSCFDYAPGAFSVPTQPTLDFVGDKGADLTSRFVIYNCGNAPLTVKDFRFEDNFQGESDYFSLEGGVTLPFDVPVGELRSLDVVMNVPANDSSLDVGGVMFIDYLDSTGADTSFTGINLRGFLNAGQIPTAKPELDVGSESIVGGVIRLTGASSTGGDEGIAATGYMWYLVEKPAGSTLILNGSPGAPTAAAIPDLPGKYVFALRVHGNTGDFVFSDEATIDVNVTVQ